MLTIRVDADAEHLLAALETARVALALLPVADLSELTEHRTALRALVEAIDRAPEVNVT